MKVLKEYITLFNHQKEALELMDENPSYGLWLEQGLGKTLIGLSDMVRKAYFGEIRSILVLAPLGAVGAWSRDLKHLTDEARALIEPIMEVTNYEQVIASRPIKGTKGANGKAKRQLSDNAERIQKKTWDYIILDEAHKIKDNTTSTHKALVKMSLKSKFRYLLTGTPVVNGELINFWAYDTFMNPTVNRGRIQSSNWGSISKFKNEYAILDNWYNPKAYIKVDEIMDHMKTQSVKMLKIDCLDLPDKLEPEIWDVPLTAKQQKYYDEMARHSTIEKHEMLAESGVVRLNYLRQIASGFLYVEDPETGEKSTVSLGSAKINVLEDWIKDNKETPVVIYYQFTDSFKLISKMLEKNKVEYLYLNGQQPNKDVWKDFQDGKGTVFLAQYQSASRGLDLFRASLMIYYEPTLSSELDEQSSDRIHRIGMHSPAAYIRLISEKTVEDSIVDALSNYTDFNDVMFTQYIDQYVRGEKMK